MHPKTLLSIPSVLVRFLEFELNPDQIQHFKTKINKLLDGRVAEFHNHTGDGDKTKIGYPFIQYRSIKTMLENDNGHKKNFNLAGLFGVGIGVELIFDLLNNIYQTGYPNDLYHFEIEEYSADVGLLDVPQKYKINHWLPLNKTTKKIEGEFFRIDNYEVWKSEMSMKVRVEFLEELIAGQILDFCEEIGFRIPEKSLKVTLLDYKTLGKVKYPNNDRQEVRFEAFDIIYEANINLPEYIGMGKGKSKGFGWQTQTSHHQLIDKFRLTPQQNNNRKRRI